MTKEEIFRGCETIIQKLPEYDSSDDLMIEGVRAAVSVKEWIDASPEAREDLKRELYRAFKAVFQVTDIDDHLTREDLKHLEKAVELLLGIIGPHPDTSVIPWIMSQVQEALGHIERAREA